MAVTAAQARKEPGYVDVEQGKIFGQALAGMEIKLIICKQTFIVWSVNRHYIFVAANHVQARACGRLDGSGIVAQPFDFSLQRLINTAQYFHIGLHN